MQKPADRNRLMMVAAAVLAVALAGLSSRSIKLARAMAAAPVPDTNLGSLSSFLGPLADSSAVTAGSGRTLVVTRDPFAPAGGMRPRPPLGGSVIPGTAQAPRPAANEPRQRWVVSSILMEGSKKSALVNNAWVTVGDPLGGGSRLAAIERDHVIVTDANGTRHKVPVQGGES
jgi:hypothetical protein